MRTVSPARLQSSAPRMADLRNATAQARSDKRNYPQHASAPGYTCTHKGTARATEGLRQRRNDRCRSVATKLEPRSNVARAALSRGSGFVQWHTSAVRPHCRNHVSSRRRRRPTAIPHPAGILVCACDPKQPSPRRLHCDAATQCDEHYVRSWGWTNRGDDGRGTGEDDPHSGMS